MCTDKNKNDYLSTLKGTVKSKYFWELDVRRILMDHVWGEKNQYS